MKRKNWAILTVLLLTGCDLDLEESGEDGSVSEDVGSRSYEVKSAGTYSDWLLPPEPTNPGGTRGYYNQDIVVFAGNDPGPSQSYFYSHQFGLVGGDGGYIGIQSDGNGKRAIFSIWQATAAYGPGIARPFSGEGEGYQTIIPYNWVPGHYYRLRVWTTGVDDVGTWWCGWIKDNSTGVENWIGCIRVPYWWHWLSSYSITWIEDYGPQHPNCDAVPYAVVYFDHPTGNAGTSRAGEPSNHYGPGSCPSRISMFGNWATHEMGL